MIPAVTPGGFPVISSGDLPWLSVEQMRDFDRLLVEEVGISLVRMMENAGRNVAVLARHLLGGDATARRVAILAGPGGNRGGGLVAARHLAVAGAQVDVYLASPDPGRRPARSLDIVAGMRLRAAPGQPDGEPDLVIDALLGYSGRGAPRDHVAALIEWAAGRRVLALDVPSGLELAAGELWHPAIEAHATITLALPKRGLRARGAEHRVGDLYLADISVPEIVYRRVGTPHRAPIGRGPLVRVRSDRDDGRIACERGGSAVT